MVRKVSKEKLYVAHIIRYDETSNTPSFYLDDSGEIHYLTEATKNAIKTMDTCKTCILTAEELYAISHSNCGLQIVSYRDYEDSKERYYEVHI